VIIALDTSTPDLKLVVIDAGSRNETIIHTDRELEVALPRLIEQALGEVDGSLASLHGIAVFAGPGSFTGLRIGHAYANALAYALDIPIVQTNGDDWVDRALVRFANNEDDKITSPQYGAAANTSKPSR
jgi:tRNA threonylcarbamoyladenosine biosynthesis protein TsaB